MDQESLFHERIEDAALAVIEKCGGRKKFAAEMWPDKGIGDAHNLLNACLNPEKREHFTPDQLMYVMRRGKAIGCHALTTYLARQAGYADPTPVDPKDEAAELMRQFNETGRAMARMVERIERLAPVANLRSVA